MLTSLDILIGFSLVMLVGSLATMLITQAMLSAAQSRGRHLLDGLAGLIVQMHPATAPADAQAIGDAVLRHPLVRGSARRRGTVIKREELIKLLFELGDKTAQRADTPPLADSAGAALDRILKANGVDDPAAVLTNVRMMAMELERTFPEMSTAARNTIALTQEARSELVAKVNAWFDQTMDRVTERFTFSSRGFSLAAAAIVVLATQLDALQVINRLSMDENMRQAFVQEAVRLDAQRAGVAADTPVSQADQERLYRVMGDAGLIRIPDTSSELRDRLIAANPVGLAMSILLLSLGAPFWFNALSSLVKLRSSLAQKDDADRLERQMDTTRTRVAPDGTTEAAAPAQTRAVAGERGDLAAVG